MNRMSSPLLSGIVFSFVSLALFALIASFLLAGTNMGEHTLEWSVYVMHGLALIIGGFVTGKKKGVKGWYYGGLLGIIYYVIILLIGFLGFDAALGIPALILLAVAFASGALGGIVGVNARK